MLCQSCKQNEAVYHFHFNYMGQVGEAHLCAVCASRLRQTVMGVLQLSEFPFLSETLKKDAGQVDRTPAPADRAPVAEVSMEIQLRRRVNAMQAQLDSAVAREDYEEAARLRDLIEGFTKEATSHEPK